jgi:hypothetical protein
MANSYNSNPIILDTDISTGWRANQTLNTGNLTTTAQQFSGAVTRQWGIRVTKIVLESVGTASVTGLVTVADPNDATVLWNFGVTGATQQAGTVITREDFATHFPAWRDFKVTGLTGTSTKIFIWYRS